MGLNVRIYDIVSDGPYSIRYKSGANPYPEYDNTTFTLYGTGLTATTIELTGLTFDTQYWIKMVDETTGRYIVKNIYTHDSKAFPCYDTICFSVGVVCENEPTPTPTPTPTSTPICSDSIRNTLSASNSYSAVGRQGMVYSASNNKAYVLDGVNSVKSFVPNSTTLTTEFSWSNNASLLGYNPTNNKLYSWQTAFPSSNMLIRNLNTNITSSIAITAITQGFGKIEYNSVLNKIYAFSQTVNFTTAQINIIDGSTDTLTNQITGLTLSNVHATAYNPNNNKLYLAQGGRIYTCSGNTLTLDVTTLPVTSAVLIALDETNNLIYLVDTTTVHKINATTNTTISSQTITGIDWNTPFLRSMIYNPDNGKLYISRNSSPSDGFLGVLDPSTGAFTKIINAGISQPLYVPTNTIYGINEIGLYEICGSEGSTPTPTSTPTSTPTLLCETPTITSVTRVSGSTFNIGFTSTAGCVAMQIEYSSDMNIWTSNTGACTSPRQVTIPGSTGEWYFRIKQICSGAVESEYSLYETYTFPIYYYFVREVVDCEVGDGFGALWIAKSTTPLTIGSFVNLDNPTCTTCAYKVTNSTTGPHDWNVTALCGTSIPVTCCV